jgi:HEAT repeats
MRRRRIILLLALVAVAAGMVLYWPHRSWEPVYQGKRLSYWIQEARGMADLESKSLSVQRQEAGRDAINAIGTNALPWLVSEFTRSESKWGLAFNRWASAHSSIGFRFRGNLDRVMTAAFGLAFMGTNAVSALPTLAPYLGDEHVGHWASIAMGGSGEMALPYFVPALTSTSRTERLVAAEGLGNAVGHSDKAIPAVIQLAQDSNVQVRLIALMALGNAKGRPDLLIPVFKEALSSSDGRILRMAAYAVEGTGEVTRAVLPNLRRLLTNSDPYVVRAASNTVQRIDPSALPARRP